MYETVLKWSLSRPILNKCFALFILICLKARFFLPLLKLSAFFVETKGPSSAQNSLLVLSAGRFRGDLDILAAEGFRLVILDYNWMLRILVTCFGKKISSSSSFFPEENASDLAAHKRLQKYFRKFLPDFNSYFKIDAVISAAVHYRADHLWGYNSDLTGVPFIIMHRECFRASQLTQRYWTDFWKHKKDYQASHVIVHNEACRKTFIDSNLMSKERCSALGTMRMDRYVENINAIRKYRPKKKQVTFFSFVHGVSLPDREMWFEKEGGYKKLFQAAHRQFVRFASKNPDVNCVIKIKWSGGNFFWEKELERCVEAEGLKLVDLPNLVITAVEDTTELIKESLGVVAFGSTTLLESSFADRPVIMPAFEEAALESYKDKVIFGEEDDLFHIARAPEEMAAMLQKMTSEEGLPTNLEKAVKMFDTWISPVSGGAVSEYCKCIQQVIEASNGNDSNKKK